MGIAESLSPATDIFSGGIAGFMENAWIFLIFVALFFVGATVWWIKKIRQKKAQWTHKLKIRRVLHDNRLSEPFYIKMRRFPLIKKAEVFELETPLLGGFLLPEPDEYSGDNEFSIILNKNNRIYVNKGEFFNTNGSDVNVSAKHAEIDINRANLKADFQEINKVSKRLEWAEIAKYAFMIIGIVCLMIVSLSAMNKWGDAQATKAEEAKAMENAMTQLKEAMVVVQATVNTQKLEILPMMKEIYKTKNLQPIINQEINQNMTV